LAKLAPSRARFRIEMGCGQKPILPVVIRIWELPRNLEGKAPKLKKGRRGRGVGKNRASKSPIDRAKNRRK
jgi:hypothetical protein